jgi:hypothetical protein
MFQFVTSEKDNHEVVIKDEIEFRSSIEIKCPAALLRLIPSIIASASRRFAGICALQASQHGGFAPCPALVRDSPKIPTFCPAVVTTGVLISALWDYSVEIATMIKANGRSALMLATLAMGLLATFAVPSSAAADDLNSPVFVEPAGNQAQPNTAQAGTNQPATDNQVAAPDQLSDTDRALPDNAAPQPPQSTVPAASNEPPPTRAAPVMAASGEHSVWDETSLIGKIFIGFGALLTVASAARMFMA